MAKSPTGNTKSEQQQLLDAGLIAHNAAMKTDMDRPNVQLAEAVAIGTLAAKLSVEKS